MELARAVACLSLTVAWTGAACASIPVVSFVGDDAGGTSGVDATVDAIAIADGAIDASLDAIADAAGDSADPDAADAAAPRYKCGSTTVVSCAKCPGSPLLCTDNGRNECLTDCTICNTTWAPCLRCLPNGDFVGRCVPFQPNGSLNCGGASLCACNGDAATCPSFAGEAQACVSDLDGGFTCRTCGEPGTAGAACVPSPGATGTCQSAPPKSTQCK